MPKSQSTQAMRRLGSMPITKDVAKEMKDATLLHYKNYGEVFSVIDLGEWECPMDCPFCKRKSTHLYKLLYIE